MERTEFSKDDSLIIKGLAILAIMLHNLFRWVAPSTGENEFGFAAHTVHKFAEQLTNQPTEFINIIFSYLGHFGVQIFILISGYGLTKSMLNKPQSWAAFMGGRLKKIYPLLIVAILGFTIANLIIYKQMPAFDAWREIGRKLLLIHTLVPGSGLSVCGPWWFFGLIVQLYVFFPILLSLTQRYGAKILAGATLLAYIWIFTAIYNYDHFNGELLAMQNAPGHLPEFCFGIWLALAPRKISSWWLVPALTVFVLGNFYQFFYPFTFLSVSVMFVIVYNIVREPIMRFAAVRRPIAFLGSISMFLFAVHGFLRSPFINLATNHSTAIGLLAALLFFATSIVVAIAVRPVYKLIVKLFDKINSPVWLPKANKYLMGGALLLLGFVGYHQATMRVFQKNIELTQNQDSNNIIFVTEDTIAADNLYTTVARIKLKRSNLIKVSVDVEIDSQSTPAGQLPLLVTDITGIFWDKCYMPKTEGFMPVHYETTIICPFFSHFNTKTLKLYFWNNKGSSMKFRNARVSVTH